MTFFSSSIPSPRLPLLVFALGALHCGDEEVLVQPPASAAGESLAGPGSEALPDTETPGSTAERDGSSSKPAGSGQADGGAGRAPSSAVPSSGGATGGECQPRGVGGPFWLTEGETI